MSVHCAVAAAAAGAAASPVLQHLTQLSGLDGGLDRTIAQFVVQRN